MPVAQCAANLFRVGHAVTLLQCFHCGQHVSVRSKSKYLFCRSHTVLNVIQNTQSVQGRNTRRPTELYCSCVARSSLVRQMSWNHC
jgi:hypothetical protein